MLFRSIWVYDTDRKGAWMKPWNIRCDWMTLYNDNSGVTHLLIVQGDKIVELSKGAKTVDDGKPFSTSALSGQLRFERDRSRLDTCFTSNLYYLAATRKNHGHCYCKNRGWSANLF